MTLAAGSTASFAFADDPHVLRAVQEYQAALERGERPDRTAIVQRFPAAGAALGDALDMVELLCRAGKPLAGPAAEPEAPARLGDFRIVRELGRGGMGVVYEAVQESIGRRVALKVLPAAFAGSPAAVERFRREAHAAGRLHHTNIVPVFGVGEDAGRHFMAMQLITGCGLDQAIVERRDKNTGPLGGLSAGELCRRVAGIGHQAADALAHAHAHGILHRDIKPSNLLLDEAGDVWVTDFGLAKLDAVADLTAAGELVGTLRYLAPERLEDVVDARSDVYSLGLVLYELLTARPAFDAFSQAALLEKIRTTSAAPPRYANPGVPRDLETVVLKCCEKEPGRRYASAADLAEDLRRWQAGEPVRARPVGPLGKLMRWCRRNPVLAGAAALAAVGLLATAAVSLHSAWRQAQLSADVQRNYDEAKRHLRDNALLALGQAHELADNGDAAKGLHWLVRALETAEQAEAADLLPILRTNVAAFEREVHPLVARPVAGNTALQVIRFTPDGDRLVVARQFEVNLFDSVSGKLVGPGWRMDGDDISRIVMTPKRRAVFVASRKGKLAWLDTSNGNVVGTADVGPRILDARATPDGRTLIVNRIPPHGPCELVFVDATTYRPDGPPVPTGRPRAGDMAVSPDGRTLAVCVLWIDRGQETLEFWDVATRQRRAEVPVDPLPGKRRHIDGMVWTPDSRHLVVAGDDDRVHVLAETDGAVVAGWRVPRLNPAALSVRPDGSGFFVGTADGQVLEWDLRGQPAGRPIALPAKVTRLALSADGRFLFAADESRRVSQFDQWTRRQHGSAVQTPGVPVHVVVPAAGGLCAAGDEDDNVLVWRPAPAADLPGPVPDVVLRPARAFAADGAHAVVMEFERPGQLDPVDARTGDPYGPRWMLPATASGYAFGTRGDWIALVTMPERETPARLHRLAFPFGQSLAAAHDLPMRSDAVATDPTGRLIAVGLADQSVQLYDAGTLRPFGEPLAVTDWTVQLAFRADGRRLAAAGLGGVVSVWDVDTRRPVRPPNQFGRAVSAVALAPDADEVYVGTGDRQLCRVELSTGVTSARWGLGNEPKHITLVPGGGAVLVHSGPAGTVDWRDRATGLRLGPLWRVPHIVAVGCGPDGRSAWAGSHTGRRWELELAAPAAGTLDEIRRRAERLTGTELHADGVVRTLDAAAWRDR